MTEPGGLDRTSWVGLKMSHAHDYWVEKSGVKGWGGTPLVEPEQLNRSNIAGNGLMA